MKKLITLICIFSSTQLTAQTGIGTTTPHASAKLEISSNNKGFLPPRIALTGKNDVTTIASPATGLVIYNTATSGTTPNNVIPGFYYYDASKWNQLVDQSSLNSFSGFNPNYAQSNASAVTKNSIGDIIVSQSITTSGRPVQIIATGDANPANNGAWVQLQLYRDGTAIGKKVQAESSSSNENVPYCLNFIDNPTTPGTYTYSVRYVGGSGAFGFGESDGNHITLLELGAWSAGTMPVSKGGTGNSSYTSGSVIFSDGTNLAQNNTNFFWDNSNGRLGIGTNTPTSKLNIAGGGVRIASGLGNSSTRPSVNTSTIGNYEIRGVGGGSSQIDGQDDGFLRLSAGGGTNAIQQSSIDLSGYSATVPDMNSNIVMRTSGAERLRIDASGSVNVTGKINLTDASGNVAVKAAGFVNAGVAVTLGDIQVIMSTSGSRSLQIRTTGSSFTGMASAHTTYSNGSYTYYSDKSFTIDANYGYIGGVTWSFGTDGDLSVYYVRDTTNQRFYRFTLMVGNVTAYTNNFISIERLL